MVYGYIYVIENTINYKLYVGQTVNLERRRRSHFSNSREQGNQAIKAAMQKYGKNHFDFVILEGCETSDELNERESYWIKELNTISPYGYNLNSGGQSFVISDETRLKMKENHWSRKHPEVVFLLRGRRWTEEAKQRKCERNLQYQKTACKWGHVFDEENTYYQKHQNGTERVCRTCKRLDALMRYRKKSNKDPVAWELRKVECKYGHPRNEENTSYFTGMDGRRYRRCKVCHRNLMKKCREDKLERS